jgi:fumarate reductase (CoM/CoB) subunit A
VVVVGSGLAGLAAALEAARAGALVTVLTPARAGRDGSSHRVHALAPWILLTAPWLRGDSPRRFLDDLQRNGGDLQREDVTAVLAARAHDGAVELCSALDLAAVEREPVVLPGDPIARGLRCRPRQTPLLAPLLAECLDHGVRICERALAVGLVLGGDRVAGVVFLDRRAGSLTELPADCVVLACGGVGAVFPRSTAPRWCRGSAIAIAGAAGALLHRPNLTQAIPVTATPPLYFPTTAALLGMRILLGDTPLPRQATLDAATVAIAGAIRHGRSVWLEPAGDDSLALLPPRVRESPTFGRERRVPLAVALHHGIGGIAIDRNGRTSIPALYACGEAAGGAQGGRRMMGTGLLEAWIFGRLAGKAAGCEASRSASAGGGQLAPANGRENEAGRAVVMPPLVRGAAALEAALDRLLGPLTGVRPAGEVAAALAELEAWPLSDGERAGDGEWLAALRRAAAIEVLRAEAGAPVAASAVGQDTEEERR